MNDNSILEDVKKMLGLPMDYDVFDQDLIIHINTVLQTIYQIGVGDKPLVISGLESTWSNLFGQATDLESIKSYLYLKVRLIFDPPASATILQAYNEMAKELEWRINITVDPGKETTV